MARTHACSAPAGGLEWRVERAGWRIEASAADSPGVRDRERELLAQNVPLPYASRASVITTGEYFSSYFITVFDVRGECVGGFAIRDRPAPLIPRHRLFRIEQFGSSIPLAAADAVVSSLLDWLRDRPDVLRLSVDVFSFDDTREIIGGVLARRGFRRAEHANGYVETLVMDLGRGEEEIFRSLHHSARRKIRQVEKQGLAIRSVVDGSLAGRMNDMLLETFARTGGSIQPRNWEERIEHSRVNPDVSRIVGLFRTDVDGPPSLLAYAWGCHSGDHVFYSEAASTRHTGDLRIPVAYGVMWDLILWAKRTGASVFDMGGITRGTHMDGDPLGGISDFKRYFSQEVVKVRDEWVLDHHSWRASVAAAIHRRLRRS